MNFRRLRRMRRSPELRELRREVFVRSEDLIMPVFVHEGIESPCEISSMPGIYQFDLASAVQEIKECQELGVGGVILFGIPTAKDSEATGAWSDNGIVQQALRAARSAGLKIPLIADTCLCEYTDHGHCGPRDACGNVENDATLALLQKTARAQARAGADIIAPSTMIDGMITALRTALDEGGYTDMPILSYGAKYASAFYGPFRDAAGSGDNFTGDRKNHQMDPGNGKEALLELEEDINEGADMLMVKPALSYLDIIASATSFGYPVWAYNVSGEYSMVKASEKLGYGDGKALREEILTSIKRAGADRIISYHAKEFAIDKG